METRTNQDRIFIVFSQSREHRIITFTGLRLVMLTDVRSTPKGLFCSVWELQIKQWLWIVYGWWLKQPHLAGRTDRILGEAAHLWCIWQSGTHFKQAISTYTGSFWHVASWFLCVILLWKINRLKHQCCVHLSPPTSWFIEKIHVEVQSPNHPFTQE